MSVRHLEALFQPGRVAVFGASARPGSVGAVVWRNLQAAGFQGELVAVNTRDQVLDDGSRTVPDLDRVADAPDLAVICTPAPTVPALVAQCARRGVRAAVVLTAGLRGTDGNGASLEQRMLDAARPSLLRILGPNCIGLQVPHLGLNASFAPGQALAGELAFVTQSGALGTAMLDWAGRRGIGFSHVVSLGDGADVDFGDVLDYLASDARTRAILMYVESVRAARKFMSAARAAARNKPVILVKAGRAPAGARAAASHTGAMAGSDAVFDAAVRRSGMLRVDSLEALFDAAQTLARVRHWAGPRLAILTNGGGAGVLAADALDPACLATLGEATCAALSAHLPATWPGANPVDIIGDAPVARYQAALDVLLAAPEVDGILLLHAPTAIVPAADIAGALLPRIAQARKPVLGCWLGGRSVEGATALFERAGVAAYDAPERAVAGWHQLVRYHRAQRALLELPDVHAAPRPPQLDRARRLVARALDAGQVWLAPQDCMELLACYGIPAVATADVRDAGEAASVAVRMGEGPLVLKIRSPQAIHKSDVGGVALDLRADAIAQAADAMRGRLLAAHPAARVDGFTVQQMAECPGAIELIVGIACDPTFGPVIGFGEGGTRVEFRADRALALPPLNDVLARDLITRTRIATLLAGYRGQPAADQQAIVDALARLSDMACDLPQLEELDINPLLADARGVLALDARVRLRHPAAGEPSRLALRPYPRELEGVLDLGGRGIVVRPIRPDDGHRLAGFYAAAAPQDLRLRFFLRRKEIPLSEIARYCQIDYEREMALVALNGGAMVGEVRAACDPDNEAAEFAIMVAGPWQRMGLGTALLRRMAAYLQARGTRELRGECLADNLAMAALARREGFRVAAGPDGTVELRKALARGA